MPQRMLDAAKHQMDHRKRRETMPKIHFIAPLVEQSADYWETVARNTLHRRLTQNELNKNVAKNVILFLGDGMSLPTLSATRIYLGGEEME